MTDELKLRKGLKILSGGNFVQKIFGNDNYDQILRSYKKEFIQTRRRKDGTTYLYHTGKKSEITQDQIQDDIELQFTGSKTPVKDLKYLSAKRKLTGLDKEINWKNMTFSDLGHMVRRRFSEKQYAGEGMPNEGEFLGTQYDIDRKEKLTKKVNKLEQASSYADKVDSSSKAPKVPNLFKSKQLDLTEIKDPQNKQIAKELHNETEQQKKIILGNILK